MQDIKVGKNIIEDKNKIYDSEKNEDKKLEKNEDKILKYIIGDSYYIEGVEYIPEADYAYNKIGLATFYNRELHNKKTINNDFNKVTALLGRHKTLPIPSIVKVTNLENGLSITIKINDRHNDNSSIIQVSRKSAQLLKFYKNKIARVRVEILEDPSKQMKVVTQSMSEKNFNGTVTSAPTEKVSIIDIFDDVDKKNESKQETPIEIGFSEVINNQMFLKVYNFKSYNIAKKLFNELELKHKFAVQNDGTSYSLIIGPLDNLEANNLVLSFISRGYKKTEFFIE